jgi:hypothetical protein
MFDFIGDIHGHADKLSEILEKMGYSEGEYGYSHPHRKVFFLGDFIDRGPQIIETLSIVRRMVESGNALAIMGNHEYNAILFHYPEKDGGHLRKHEIKNIIQHFETLKQFNNKQEEYEDYLDWFLTLPLFYENNQFRAVHACWDQGHIDFLRSRLNNDRLNSQIIYECAVLKSALYSAVEDTLKGKELKIPDGLSFQDKEGNHRHYFRIKWWENPLTSTYQNISIDPAAQLPDHKISAHLIGNDYYYNKHEKPVFFGHYWLKLENHPSLFRNNICCLDFSVAKHGHLAAYRYDNEEKLDWNKIVFV